MTRKHTLCIFLAVAVILLTGCITRFALTPGSATNTVASPSQTPAASATSLPPEPTETPTQAPATPASIPVNAIQHFAAGQPFRVTAIDMHDAYSGWAIGGLEYDDAHVLRTSDGGDTWTDVTPPEELAQDGDYKVATGYFEDLQTAWVIYSQNNGHTPTRQVVWRTADAGLTWQASQPLDTADLGEFYNPSHLQFVDGQAGWLLVHVGVGMNHDYVVLYRSGDGGQTWERLVDPYTDMSGIMGCLKTGMLFTDATHGWLTGDCQGVAAGVLLFQSMDGGATWSRVSLPDPAGAAGLFTNMLAACGAYDPFFWSNELGRMAVNCVMYEHDPLTYQYYVFTTQDGGATWSSSTYPGERLYFITPDTGWALALKIQRSTDGGLTWTAVSDVSWKARVDFVSDQLGWAVATAEDEMALVMTTNGGERWTMLTPIVAGG
jgi:photosystem II stability/assembly factor-like uncharacterized protein